MFFGSLTLLEGKSVGDAKERISEAYVPTLIRNWYGPSVQYTVHPLMRSLLQGCLHSHSNCQLCGGATPPALRHDWCRLALLEYVHVSQSYPDMQLTPTCPDAYLSSVNAKKQVEIAAEHQHEHRIDEKEID